MTHLNVLQIAGDALLGTARQKRRLADRQQKMSPRELDRAIPGNRLSLSDSAELPICLKLSSSSADTCRNPARAKFKYP